MTNRMLSTIMFIWRIVKGLNIEMNRIPVPVLISDFFPDITGFLFLFTFTFIMLVNYLLQNDKLLLIIRVSCNLQIWTASKFCLD